MSTTLQASSAQERVETSTTTSDGPGVVLVVDDSPVDARLAASIIQKRLGMRVEFARDGRLHAQQHANFSRAVLRELRHEVHLQREIGSRQQLAQGGCCRARRRLPVRLRIRGEVDPARAHGRISPFHSDLDPMAVLDSRFRVRGTSGLRVVDASVFPRIPGTFILLPTYMVSEKAVDVLLGDIGEKRKPL